MRHSLKESGDIDIERAAMLYGTVEPATEGRALRAGPLELEVDRGALKYICLGGREILREIAFVVRDKNWLTYAPDISAFHCEQSEDGFFLSFTAECADERQALRYRIEATGRSDGSIDVEAMVEALCDFETGRTGFVVLHPITLAGEPARLLHTDGRIEETHFPRLIKPSQPMFDIRALSQELDDSCRATIRMEGDAFEMEDQRNWSDASFKTYIRPLWKPRLYTLPAGERQKQSVTIRLDGAPLRSPAIRRESASVTVHLGGPSGGILPRIGIGIPAEEARSAWEVTDALRRMAPGYLIHQLLMPRPDPLEQMQSHRRLSEAVGAEPWLEVVIEGKRPPEEELSEVAEVARQAGFSPTIVAVFPLSDLTSRQPGEEDLSVPPAAQIVAAARQVFPQGRIGGGAFSYFTELNRKRPPAELLDFVTHCTCPIVHSADDRAVMETLDTLPDIIASTRAFIGNTPYCIGPSSLGTRQTPYGRGLAPNPGNARLCLTDREPRQRGLFGSAWLLGYIAACARGGIQAVAMGAATGPLGFLHRGSDPSVPLFDDQDKLRFYPSFHVMAGLASGQGRELARTDISEPSRVAALAWFEPTGLVVWLSNLTGKPVSVGLEGLPEGEYRQSVLDCDSFMEVSHDEEALRTLSRPFVGPALTLDAYGTIRIARATAPGSA